MHSFVINIISACHRSFKEMVGITVAEPIVPVYLDKAAMRKLKMKEGQGIDKILDKLFYLIIKKSELTDKRNH